MSTEYSHNLDLPTLEKRVLTRWENERTFEESLDPTRPLWVFLEGPPTMNGQPGVHHAEARTFKDLYGRYQTMRGYHVPRTAGWDCHGLPVELTVTARDGRSAQDLVADVGLAAFEELCRQSVEEHQEVFEDLTRRLGYWVDLENPYRTMDPSYMEAVWGLLKGAHQQGMLYRADRVAPWCTSCQTALSSHEVAQGYEDVTDTAATVRLRSDGADLLVWTTTPWTLTENLLVGVGADVEYVEVQTPTGRVLVSRTHQEQDPALQAREVVATHRGRDLAGRRYQPPFGEQRPDAHRVVVTPFVEDGVGTGLVHLAPAHGADDQQVARAEGLSYRVALGPDGVFREGPFTGEYYQDAGAQVLELLGEQLWSREELTHSYPHCWRCHNRLVYLARPCWYLATSSVAPGMLEENAETFWQPPVAGEKRYGTWLAENVDWAVSRERYWGTPLPLWECPEGHVTPVGSRAELSELSGTDHTASDLHRSDVDPVTFPCSCGAEARRVSEVVDCWLDAGAAPLALWGTAPPTAELVAEGVDQTRGWFYALQAVAHLSHGRRAYRRALALGHVVDANGQKMSKHKGNVLDPFELFDNHGADAVRWQFLTDGSPWTQRRMSPQSVRSAAAELTQLWACVTFLPEGETLAGESSHPLDQWLRSRLAATTREVTRALEAYDPQQAGAALKAFVDDLSLRYLRSSRNRLATEDTARSALRDVLLELTRLLAPFTPFLAEAMFERLGGSGSVHHQTWPEVQEVEEDPAVGELWRLVEDGRRLRAKGQVRQRQPLRSATVRTGTPLGAELLEVLKEQLNVRELTVTPAAWQVKPNWRALGRRFGKRAPQVAALLPVEREATGPLEVVLDGETLHVDEVEYQPVAPLELDLVLDAELLEAGEVADLLREVVDARKAAGYRADDEVTVSFTDPHRVALARRGSAELERRHTTLLAEGGELVL